MNFVFKKFSTVAKSLHFQFNVCFPSFPFLGCPIDKKADETCTLKVKARGSMIISLLMNINLGHLGGASILRMFTTTRPHGSVNTTTWLGISQFFLFLAPNFNILTTENRSICNRDLN